MGGLTVTHLRDQEGDDMPAGKVLIADRRIYVNADGTKALEEGDPEAAFLLASKGSTISIEDQKRLNIGIKGDRIVIGKKSKKSATKAAKKPEDK